MLNRAWRAGRRVFPRVSMLAQAIAFNVFLAFFPTLLLVVSLASTWVGNKTALTDAIRDLIEYLPPGSQAITSEFLGHRSGEVWKLALVGWAGTLLGGSQVMKLIMEGIHMIYGDDEQIGFLHRQLRGLLLLLITMVPILTAGILGVFGRPLRHWATGEFGQVLPIHGLWLIFFPSVAMVLAMLSLAVIYWVARPNEESIRGVLPGAAVATLCWWLVNVIFGFYVRRVPYNVVYGGLAAVIGLLIWMQISAFVVFFGAGWNAEASGSSAKPPFTRFSRS